MAIKVLIVDDERVVGKTLELILKHAGLDAKFVDCAEKAYLESENGGFDVLVCDLNLNGLADGIKVIDKIKKLLPETKVVLNSGSEDLPPDIGNIDAITFKPNNPGDLAELICKLVPMKAA